MLQLIVVVDIALTQAHFCVFRSLSWRVSQFVYATPGGGTEACVWDLRRSVAVLFGSDDVWRQTGECKPLPSEKRPGVGFSFGGDIPMSC